MIDVNLSAKAAAALAEELKKFTNLHPASGVLLRFGDSSKEADSELVEIHPKPAPTITVFDGTKRP